MVVSSQDHRSEVPKQALVACGLTVSPVCFEIGWSSGTQPQARSGQSASHQGRVNNDRLRSVVSSARARIRHRPRSRAAVAWEEKVLTSAAKRLGCIYVGTASSTPADDQPIADLLAALEVANASVVVVPSTFHFDGDIPSELLARFHVAVENMGVVYSPDWSITRIPSSYHEPAVTAR